MRDDLCEIIMLVDRSGSMQSVRGDMQGAIDAFVTDQKTVPGEALLTLVQFNDRAIETVHEAMPLAQFAGARIDPAGNTPLLDAIGRTIVQVGKRLAATDEAARPGKVLFVIVTDGQENASREYTKDAIKAMIEEQTKVWKWQFSFFGANVDAFAEAASLGIPAIATANFAQSPSGVRNMARAASVGTRVYRGGGTYRAH